LQCNLNWIQTPKLNSNTLNWIEFNDWIKIQLKINGMQIGGKGNENILVNTVLKNDLRHKYEMTSFMPFHLKMG
jgi:hypothetical protein